MIGGLFLITPSSTSAAGKTVTGRQAMGDSSGFTLIPCHLPHPTIFPVPEPHLPAPLSACTPCSLPPPTMVPTLCHLLFSACLCLMPPTHDTWLPCHSAVCPCLAPPLPYPLLPLLLTPSAPSSAGSESTGHVLSPILTWPHISCCDNSSFSSGPISNPKPNPRASTRAAPKTETGK